jgi:hypothetical protein
MTPSGFTSATLAYVLCGVKKHKAAAITTPAPIICPFFSIIFPPKIRFYAARHIIAGKVEITLNWGEYFSLDRTTVPLISNIAVARFH